MENSRSHLPQSWVPTTLGLLGKWTSGGTPSRKINEYFGGTIPWVLTGDLTDGPIKSIPNTITDKGLNNSSAKLFPEGTLLIAMYGATIGKLGILECKAATNQACAALLPNESNKEILKYIFYYLLSERENLRNIGQGGAQPNINQDILKNYNIPLAPLNEQKRIIDKIEKLFSDLDNAEANLKKVQSLIKSYRQSVLKAAVTGELTKEWRKKKGKLESGEELLKRILKARQEKWKGKYTEPKKADISSLPNLPKGWSCATIEQISSDVDYGSSSKCTLDNNGVPVLRMGNIFEGHLVFDNLKYLPNEHDEFPKLLLQPGDLLFNRTNSVELVGKTAIYKGNPQLCSFASYLIRVKFIECKSDFISAFINSIYGKQWILSVVSQQVGQANVNGSKLKALTVPLPPIEEQKEIVETLSIIFSQIDSIQKWCESELCKSTALRQSILKSAFSGKLVSQNSSDEPANELLKRIETEKTHVQVKSKHSDALISASKKRQSLVKAKTNTRTKQSSRKASSNN